MNTKQGVWAPKWVERIAEHQQNRKRVFLLIPIHITNVNNIGYKCCYQCPLTNWNGKPGPKGTRCRWLNSISRSTTGTEIWLQSFLTILIPYLKGRISWLGNSLPPTDLPARELSTPLIFLTNVWNWQSSVPKISVTLQSIDRACCRKLRCSDKNPCSTALYIVGPIYRHM